MKTLIVEDSSTLCAIYEAYLDNTGLDVYSVGSLTEAQQALGTLSPELILLDVELPDGSGLDLLSATVAMDPPPAVVVMTGNGMEYADDAMDRGADDFLAKPFDASRLRVTLINAAKKLELSQRLNQATGNRSHLGALYGSSAIMQVLYNAIEAVAGEAGTPFIFGEVGSGKAKVARTIHRLSDKSPGDFVTLNCQSVSDATIESVLFGEAPGVGGRITPKDGLLHQARNGVLHLENIDALSLDAQRIVLEYIQTGEFVPVGTDKTFRTDVRIIASSVSDLVSERRSGKVLPALFKHLYEEPLRVPPLRERGGDLVELAVRWLSNTEVTEDVLTPTVVEALRGYYWPGNIGQLKSVITTLSQGGRGAFVPAMVAAAISESETGLGS